MDWEWTRTREHGKKSRASIKQDDGVDERRNSLLIIVSFVDVTKLSTQWVHDIANRDVLPQAIARDYRTQLLNASKPTKTTSESRVMTYVERWGGTSGILEV